MALGTFIPVGESLAEAVGQARTAERLGYDAAYVNHVAGLDSLTTTAAYAAATVRIRVGTGVMPIYSRTPVASAQSIAAIDEMSGGRAVLGLGVSHQITVEGWYGQSLERPVSDMREYLGIVRAIMRGEDPPAGERFKSAFHFLGYEPRADLPIYVGALAPRMLRLSGELADGAMLWLCSPDYVREVVVPEVTKGRERAGRDLDGFDLVAAVPAAVTDDVETARAQLRGGLPLYFSLPFYRRVLESAGFGDDIAGFDAGMARNDPEGALAAISDRFLDTLAAIGSAEDVERSVRRYQEAGVTSPCLAGIPGTDFEATLEGVAHLAAS